MTPAAFIELGGTITPIHRNPPERRYLAELRTPNGGHLIRLGYGKDEQEAVTAAYTR